MRSRMARLMLAAAIAGVAGCGGGGEDVAPDTDNSAERFSGEKRQAAQVVEDFSAAIAVGEWSHICDDLYTRTEARLTAGLLGGSCADELEQAYAENQEMQLTVNFVRFDEEGATVFSKDDQGNNQAFSLEEAGGEWRIDGFGGTFGADE